MYEAETQKYCDNKIVKISINKHFISPKNLLFGIGRLDTAIPHYSSGCQNMIEVHEKQFILTKL